MAGWKPTSKALDNALGLGIYDGMRSENESQVFRTLLYEAAGLSHIRQLYEVFGPEGLLKFFDLFAGVTIKVPSRNKIEQALRDTRIFFLMHRAKVGHRASQARELGHEFGISPHTVHDIYVRIRKRFEVEQEKQCQLKNTN